MDEESSSPKRDSKGHPSPNVFHTRRVARSPYENPRRTAAQSHPRLQWAAWEATGSPTNHNCQSVSEVSAVSHTLLTHRVARIKGGHPEVRMPVCLAEARLLQKNAVLVGRGVGRGYMGLEATLFT